MGKWVLNQQYNDLWLLVLAVFLWLQGRHQFPLQDIQYILQNPADHFPGMATLPMHCKRLRSINVNRVLIKHWRCRLILRLQ